MSNSFGTSLLETCVRDHRGEEGRRSAPKLVERAGIDNEKSHIAGALLQR